jgi:hypothetical protein
MKLARLLFLALLLLTPFAGLAGSTAAVGATPVASPVASSALSELSSYEIAATLDPNGSISATERLHYVNATGAGLTDIAFRLYPNASYYGAGALTVQSVTLNGRPVVPTYQVDDTAMLVAFPEPLAQDASADLAIAFTTEVPLDSTASYGIFTRHTDTGDWIICDWNPIVAGRDATGWRLDPPGPGGDPTFSDAAFFSATITAPSNLTIIASGGESRNLGTGATATWATARTPLREFTFIASPTLQRFDRPVGDHVVSAYLHPGANQSALATLVLDGAAAALQTYEPLFGAYAYHQLDIIDVPLAGALGVSWTGLLFVNGGLLFPSASADAARLQFTLAHEISHQWWGALVGSNTNDHAFLAEGMANCSAVLFFLKNQGLDAASTQLTTQVARPYLSALNSVGDGVVDRPSSANASGPSLGILIYGKAALGFLAIREAIGADAFAAALTAYVVDFSWRVSQPNDLRAEFQAQTTQDIGSLWNFWFDSTTVTPEVVQTVVDHLN